MTCFLLWAKAQRFVHSPLFAQGLSLVLWFFLTTEFFSCPLSSALLLAVQRCWRQYSAAPSFLADSGSLLSWRGICELIWSWAWAWGCLNQTCHLETQEDIHQGGVFPGARASWEWYCRLPSKVLTAPPITLVHTAPAGHTALAPHQQWEEAAF